MYYIISEIGSDVITWSDQNQISIIIRNLTSNTPKFTPENGTIKIGANEKANHWEIWIKDTDIGLPEEAINKIFNENETVTTYGTDNEKGTGLGLVRCKELVENNDGEIWVDSVLGERTCFYFSVPKFNEHQHNG
ncbi:ATP-binding protein [Maribacter stanieri]|uniref:ATP-binding protein n=1 Tax=Maribacter stanieri TaxID=440514 RepID=UPI003CD0D6EC